MSKLHVGICGAGMGGLTAAIAIARAGAKVTLLEAAKELGEIGAGIQVFLNVSRLLVRWGVDKLIGDNLIAVDEINT
jgi:salicylate hydroxylase